MHLVHITALVAVQDLVHRSLDCGTMFAGPCEILQSQAYCCIKATASRYVQTMNTSNTVPIIATHAESLLQEPSKILSSLPRQNCGDDSEEAPPLPLTPTAKLLPSSGIATV